MATLALGLRDDSRVKKEISGNKITLEQMLYALMVDNLQFLAWTKTKSAQKGHDRPESIFKKLTGTDEKKKDDLISFETPEAYEQYMKTKREGWQNG